MSKTAKVGGGLLATAVAGLTALASARSSIPKPPDPPPFDRVLDWLVSGNDWLAVATAVFAGIAAGWSIWQMFQPSAASRADVRAEVAGGAARTTAEVREISGQIHAEAAGAEARDIVTHRLLAGDIVERTQAAIEAGALDGAQRLRLISSLTAAVQAQTQATPQEALLLAETTADLAQSHSEVDQRIAGQVIAGNVMLAADRLVEQAQGDQAQAAGRYLQAARLYAPFAPAQAREAYVNVVRLDPSDPWGWIELARLERRYGTLDSASRCLAEADKHTSDDMQRSAVETELGDIAIIRGDVAEGRRHHQAALAIDKGLADSEPDDLTRQYFLAVSHSHLARLGRRLNDESEATRHSEAALAIWKMLTAEQPKEALFRWGTYSTLGDLGDRALEEGDLDSAENLHEAARSIADELVTEDPDNTQWQRDLSVGENRLGDIALRRGDVAAARDRYQKGLVLRLALAAKDPVNLEWQRDLSVSHCKLGDLEIACQDYAAARKHHLADAEIAETLARHEPDNIGWQYDLYLSIRRLANIAEREGDIAGAIAHLERAERMIVEVVRRAGEDPTYIDDVGMTRHELKRLRAT